MIRWLRTVSNVRRDMVVGYLVLIVLCHAVVYTSSFRPLHRFLPKHYLAHVAAGAALAAWLANFLAAVTYAGARSAHLGDKKYVGWLQTVPWHAGKPLPLGPMQLVWQDTAVVGALTLITYLPHHWIPHDMRLRAAGFVLLAFGGIYLFMSMLSMRSLGRRVEPWLIAIGLGALARLWWCEWLMLVVAGILCLIAYVGVRGVLTAFPIINPQQAPITAGLGGSFDSLSPRDDAKPARLRSALMRGLLIGWLVYLGAWMKSDDGKDIACGAGILVSGVAIAAGAIRLLVYKGNFAAPVSIRGRLAAGRLIIPRHDQVFIAPLVTAVIGPVVFYTGIGLGASVNVAFGLAIGIVYLAAKMLPPSLRNWRLTGECRIRERMHAGNPEGSEL